MMMRDPAISLYNLVAPQVAYKLQLLRSSLCTDSRWQVTLLRSLGSTILAHSLLTRMCSLESISMVDILED
jgi:hypothetical protein